MHYDNTANILRRLNFAGIAILRKHEHSKQKYFDVRTVQREIYVSRMILGTRLYSIASFFMLYNFYFTQEEADISKKPTIAVNWECRLC